MSEDHDKLFDELIKMFDLMFSASSHQETLDIVSDFMIKAIVDNQLTNDLQPYEKDSKIILQMMFTKTLTMKSMLNGMIFKMPDGKDIELTDSGSMASLVRNTYETVGFFCLLNRHTKDADEKMFIYNLWRLSSFKNKKKFEDPDFARQVEENRIQIDELTEFVTSSRFYTCLNDREKERFDRFMNNNGYLVEINDGKPKTLAGKDLLRIMSGLDGRFINLYGFLSQFTHPSYFSVKQFGDRYANYYNWSLFFLFLAATFISDYIHLFPNVYSTFESLPQKNKQVINNYNRILRGSAYVITNQAT